MVLISQGISLFIVVSSMLADSANTAPTASSRNKIDAVTFTLPPLIPSRVIAPNFPAGSHDLETVNAVKNRKCIASQGGNETMGGYCMGRPSDAPSFSDELEDSTTTANVVVATTAQITELKKYAGIASTAYCRSVVPLNAWTCKNCLKFVPDGKLIITFASLITDSTGFVLTSDAQKTIYLVFRGTNSIRNTIADLVSDLINYTPVSGAKVHRGFYASHKEVVGAYFFSIQSQLTAHPTYKVIVTGHSLGGTQALLAGMDLYQREARLSKSNLSIFTVGMPRVGNPAFAYYVGSTGIPVSRSVNNRDIVPHFAARAFGYLHSGVEAWIRSSSKVQICTPNIETSLCSNSIVPFTSFTDHSTYYGIHMGVCL